jgi:hypothetical protein
MQRLARIMARCPLGVSDLHFMTRSIISAVATVVVTCCVSASVAQARPTNATFAYLTAYQTLQRAIDSHLEASHAALTALNVEASTDCPQVAAHATAGSQLEAITAAVQDTAELTEELPNSEAARAFTRQVRHLRWPSHQLTTLVRRYAATQLSESQLTVHPLCAELRTWVADAYARLPDGTTRLLTQLTKIRRGATGAAEEELFARLSHYATGSTHHLFIAVMRLRKSLIISQLNSLIPTITALDAALGLNDPSSS